MGMLPGMEEEEAAAAVGEAFILGIKRRLAIHDSKF